MKSNESEYTDRLEVAEKIIREEVAFLQNIADALYVVGMRELADEISCSAARIKSAEREIKDATIKELSSRAKDASKEMGAILKAALEVSE